jgi:hypothetical protein
VFRAVAWGMKDFSNHSAPMKSSVQPFEDVATLKSIHQRRTSKIVNESIHNIRMVIKPFRGK